jgi:hypothetical protein
METATEQKPCAAEALLGTEQEILHGQGKSRRAVKGTIIDWRHGTGEIETMRAPEDGSRGVAYPSFKLKLKPADGSKALWIGPFKDGNNPYPSDTWLGWVETMNRREPGELVRSIRRTLCGHCAGEQITYQYNDDAWTIAAFQALDDICELAEKHFPDSNEQDFFQSAI